MRLHARGRSVVAGCALTTWLLGACPAFAQSRPFADLVSELAGAIAAAVAPVSQVYVVGQLARDLSAELTTRGLRIAAGPAADVASVAFTCSQNLRELACVADVRVAEASHVVVASRPHVREADNGLTVPIVLEMRPLVSQRDPVLDAALQGDRLFVLDAAGVTRYEKSGHEWRARDARPIASRRPWPRDLRGRLRVDAASVEAFLPGLTCRGTLDSPGLACSDEPRAWPIGIDNVGLVPARNYFAMPGGREYYAVAPLGADAGARWLAASTDGRVVFLDASREPLETIAWTGEDVAAVATPCAPGTHVLISSRAPASGDTMLRLVRVNGRQLSPVAAPLSLSGPLTALWAAPNGDGALAVIRNDATGRYEAFRVGVSCGR